MADRSLLTGGFGDLSYIDVEIIDDKGRVVTDGANLLRFDVKGPGGILAVGNGNPVSVESYVGCVRSAWRGVATVVIRADGNPGAIILSVESDGLEPTEIEIQVL
jgi:beta-galactosidase